MQIDWIQLCVLIVSIIGMLFSCFKWVIGRLDKITDSIDDLRDEFVSKELCRSQHGDSCRRLEDLEGRVASIESRL